MINLITVKSLAQVAEEESLTAFRISRQASLDSAVVETTNGNQYNADERSISRMANALLAMSEMPANFVVNWVMANTDTGIMTSTTKADLAEAHRLAVENMTAIWSR